MKKEILWIGTEKLEKIGTEKEAMEFLKNLKEAIKQHEAVIITREAEDAKKLLIPVWLNLIKQAFFLTEKDLAKVFKEEQQTLQRWQEGEAVPDEAEKVLLISRIKRIAELALQMYPDPAERMKFLVTEPAEGYLTPLELILDGYYDELKDLFERALAEETFTAGEVQRGAGELA